MIFKHKRSVQYILLSKHLVNAMFQVGSGRFVIHMYHRETVPESAIQIAYSWIRVSNSDTDNQLS